METEKTLSQDQARKLYREAKFEAGVLVLKTYRRLTDPISKIRTVSEHETLHPSCSKTILYSYSRSTNVIPVIKESDLDILLLNFFVNPGCLSIEDKYSLFLKIISTRESRAVLRRRPDQLDPGRLNELIDLDSSGRLLPKISEGYFLWVPGGNLGYEYKYYSIPEQGFYDRIQVVRKLPFTPRVGMAVDGQKEMVATFEFVVTRESLEKFLGLEKERLSLDQLYSILLDKLVSDEL